MNSNQTENSLDEEMQVARGSDVLRMLHTIGIVILIGAAFIYSTGLPFEDVDKHKDAGKVLLCLALLVSQLQIQSLGQRLDGLLANLPRNK